MAQLDTIHGEDCESETCRSKMVTSFPTRDCELEWKIENFSRLPLDMDVDTNDFCPCGGHFSIIKSKHDMLLSFASSVPSTTTMKGDISVSDILGREWSRTSVQFTHRHSSTKVITYMSNSIKCFNRFCDDVLIFKFRMQMTKHCPVTKTYHYPDVRKEGFKKLSSDMKRLFREPIKTDVELRTNNGRIHAHWCILCARSPYFRRLFQSDRRESDRNCIQIMDMEFSTLQRLVQFLYTGDIGLLEDDTDDLRDLYRAANRFEVVELREICRESLLASITADSSNQLLKLAEIHRDGDFKREVLEFVRSGWNSDSFVENYKSSTALQTTLLADVERVQQQSVTI